MPGFSRILRRTLATVAAEATFPTSPSAAASYLYKERNFNRIVDQFKKSSALDHFRTKNGVYENVVRRLASAGRFDQIHEILDHQKGFRDIKKEGFVARLICLYGKHGMFDYARKLFDEMPQLECDRTVVSLNALLTASVNSKKFNENEALYTELPEKLGIKLDGVSYNVIVKGFCESGDFERALAMLNEMEKMGFSPNVITFNTLLNFLYRKNRPEDGDRVWRMMEEKGVAPDVRSYSSKLVGLTSRKKMKEAVELIDEIKSKGIKPDLFCYNSLIKGYANEGDLDEVKTWHKHIVKNTEYDPDKATFGIIIPLACEKGDADYAYQLCKDIFHLGCLIDPPTLQKAVDELVKQSRMKEAEEVRLLGRNNKYFRYILQVPATE
ncbi:hypothetical protein MLD38_019376 [Melastoma candidum]|uniref:Uncharacterized protein n=1 Tax=Melastoma candidum TaxID=119954 RepID=A0ACB9R533_9MYRT|nr:hypothetical protein MLD38_019376 [Melastoma candidum]